MEHSAVQHAADRALRLSEVCHRLGMSRTTLWRLMRDGKFPKPIPVSQRVFVWMESDIAAYIESQRRNKVNAATQACAL